MTVGLAGRSHTMQARRRIRQHWPPGAAPPFGRYFFAISARRSGVKVSDLRSRNIVPLIAQCGVEGSAHLGKH